MALDWSNERYVRLYTRDTADTAAWSWQARALWPWLIARADGAGMVETNKGPAGVAAAVRLPLEVVAPGLDELVADGCVFVTTGGYAIRNYVEAQNARASDTSRKARQRDKDRAVAASESRGVTRGHAESHAVRIVPPDVTPSRAEPSRDPFSLSGRAGARDPCTPVPVPVAAPPAPPAPPSMPTPAPDFAPVAPAVAHVALAVELLNAERVAIDPAAQLVDFDQGDEMALAGHLRALPEDRRAPAIRHGVAAIGAAVRAGREPLFTLRPGELVGPRSWRKWQAAAVAVRARGDPSAPRAPARGQAPVSSVTAPDGDQLP